MHMYMPLYVSKNRPLSFITFRNLPKSANGGFGEMEHQQTFPGKLLLSAGAGLCKPKKPRHGCRILFKILYFFIITFSSLILVRNSFFNLSDSILYSIFLRILNVL